MFGSHSSSTPEDPVSPTTASAPTGSDSKHGSHGKASQLLASAKNSLSSIGSTLSGNKDGKDGKEAKKEERSFKVHHPEEAPEAPKSTNPHNNSAGDSQPGPNSTFRVGVTEDRNRKCRRTMEDTHSFIYDFLSAPVAADGANTSSSTVSSDESHGKGRTETDNGYFAIFDGHAGAYAADWCGKRLHIVLEETIKKFPDTPIPELLDATFTNCDSQLEKLPMRNSGCTAVCAVLRWEDRPLSTPANTGSAEAARSPPQPALTERKRVLYTANVGDARIVLCRGGKAMRLSYDHKGSDEHESKRVSNAGGLILNNRVNGVLAVTRALGDSYMKELVTGHPYTTETVLQADDEFFILACDGLWDVCSDQEAVDLVRDVDNPQDGSKILVDHALQRFSSDNLSCMIVRLDHNKASEKTVPQIQNQTPVEKSSSIKETSITTEVPTDGKDVVTSSKPDAPETSSSKTSKATDTTGANAPTVVDMAHK